MPRRGWWSELSPAKRRGLLCDLLGTVGLILVSVGLAWVYAPLGLIVPGLAFCLLAFWGAHR